ncbi:MAG: SRPBCC domain-containing protein [Kribbellaceae bacterium]
MTLNDTTGLAPLVKTVTVPTTPDRAFHLFTAEMSAWWPLVTHSVGEQDARRIEIGEGVGARLVEYGDDGPLGVWGTVSVWDPPNAVAFSWHPGTDPAQATQVSVTFTAVAEGTEVVLTHTDWYRRPDGVRARTGYVTGWDHVLGRFVAASSSRP